MHDVTSLLSLKRRGVPKKTKAYYTKTFIKQILEEPYKLVIMLKRYIKTDERPNISEATDKAMIKLA